MEIKYNDDTYFIHSINETVLYLKMKIAQIIKKPVESIRLIYNGYPVSNETILTNDAIVHCVLQLC
jgi:hypothetical protein